MYNLDGCGFSNVTIWVTTNVYFITFYIILPYYVTLGFLSNVILIIAFAKNLESDGNFGYQMLVVCSKTFQIMTAGPGMAFSYWWAGLGGDSADWFVSNYSLMTLTFSVLIPLFSIGIFASIFGGVAMTADRVLVLCRPTFYQTMNHRLHTCIACCIIFVLSVGLSIDKAWLFEFVPKENSTAYAVVPTKSYGVTPLAQSMAAIRTFVRLSMVIVLILLNLVVVVLFRKRSIRIESMTISTQAKAEARKQANRDLVMLCICQSCLTCVDQIPNTVHDMLRQASTYWNKCSYVMVCEADASFMLAQSLEFFVIIIINKTVRQTVTNFACWKAFCQKCFKC